MKKLIPVIAGILTATAVVGGIVGVARRSAGGQQADATTPGSRIRWVNVSIDAPPEGSAVQVSINIPFTGTPNPTFSHRYTIRLYVEVSASAPGFEPVFPTTVIDAETGEILSDTLTAQYPEARAILSSLALETGLPEVWPFVDAPVPDARIWLAGMMLPVPSRESGLIVSMLIGYCTDFPGCSSAYLKYGSSIMYLYPDEATGAIVVRDGSNVAPEHAPAFERFKAAVKQGVPPAPPTPTPYPAEGAQ
jgi:hypothetical protein